jgi:beta-barrel assembly-enhancing protease
MSRAHTITRRLSLPLLVWLASASAAGALALVSVKQEIEIGREAQAEIKRKTPEVRDEVVANYVESLGRRLEAHAEGPEYPYTFSVADKNDLNAFALPGGPVWVHRGILEAAQDEAQLAGVMAHEIAHVARRHSAEQLTKAMVANGLLGLLGAIVDDRSKGGTATRVGAGLATQVMFLKFSRDHEREADRVGAEIVRRAGYDPQGMAEFFELLDQQRQRSPNSVATFLSTHPDPKSRAAELRATVQSGGRRTSDEFTAMKARLGNPQRITQKD